MDHHITDQAKWFGFFENGTKLKIPLEIIPPLKQELLELKPQRDALLHQEQLWIRFVKNTYNFRSSLKVVVSYVNCDNYVPQWWVEFNDELVVYLQIQGYQWKLRSRMGISAILRRIWLFSANKIKKNSESF